jgi:hypothetical protein
MGKVPGQSAHADAPDAYEVYSLYVLQFHDYTDFVIESFTT